MHFDWCPCRWYRFRVFGGLGLAILSFVFGLKPAGLPIDVMFMIMAVVAAAAAMQAAGGLDYMIKLATNIYVVIQIYYFIAPLVTWTFTVLAGTGHVAYSVLPVIAEVSRHNGIRPERPLSMAVIASQFAIVASPIAAAVVAVVAF
ncbi:anaerobic C4-dicarboxylate transporter [Actinobacillus equuli]|nr:anaerobic C4-dicarboxylate transporter [Actinobacillus equuli]